MSWYAGIILTIVLLLTNAFFVAAEFALISARRTRVEPKAQGGSRIAKITLYAIEHVSIAMAGAQLGITICSLALGSISEPVIASLLEGPFRALGVPDSAQHPIAFVIAIAIVTYLHVVIGEMVPKNIALAGPERSAYVLAPVLMVIVAILYPIIWLLNKIANLGLRTLRVQPKDEVTSTFTRNEVASLVGESRTGGMLESNDERLLLGALQFEDYDVSKVLIPMSKMRMLPQTVTPAQAEDACAHGFSRFPITGPNLKPIGYIHIKDVLTMDPAERMQPIRPDVVRPLPEVLLTNSLRTVLTEMQRARAHLALVRGAHGEALGIVALEDVLEELVGEVRDDSRRIRPIVRTPADPR
ncbi:CBS domain containing-hemolysin-like protein [Antricoccus suffuscus]|uniref:CBS domain containing-hemolysin-like protein n=1 Tax=Antricoccus suffuscus TaxID=1629062 RepID=A0A2T1A2B6_9ACTN|nr:hemolysin family protein [Antricoccus suffuscus]PRZ42742.1 CBS domain containing-hemolysin-like protein [Antricoccus suffuscus]